MRISSIFTLLCATAALILSFLVLFAGHSRNFLEMADLLTLNVSRIGHGIDAFNTTDGNGGFFDNALNDIEGDLNNLIGDAASDIASALNLSDWYSVHIMDFCEGQYKPNASLAIIGQSVSKNVTYCSSTRGLFHFNATAILERNLPHKITLEDIHWPQGIQDAERAVRVTTLTMDVFYIIGIIFTGLAFFGAILGIFTEGRLSALGNVILGFLAFLSLGIASAMATAILVKVVKAINKYGEGIGVSATRGALFLGMTWAAVTLMLLATIMSFIQLIVGRRPKPLKNEKQVGY